MIVLFTVVILSVSALGNNAHASHVSGGGGTIDVVAAEGSNTISINGTTDKNDEVIIKVLAPNRNLVSIDQITPTDGSYSTTIKTSALWNQDGEYTITVQQSQGAKQFEVNTYNHLVRVEVISGTTSATSISYNYLIDHDQESYFSNQNTPTTPSIKKLTITASGIEGSNTINVSGTTDRSDVIIIKVTAPNGNLVSVDQITPTDNSYSTTIKTGGPLWSQDGMYMIKARQGPTTLGNTLVGHVVDSPNIGLINYQTSAEIEIIDGHVIPEFGVIAAMILAIAIVSIIVVTAKTKLSIVPRY